MSDNLLLESGDALLLESGDHYLLQSAVTSFPDDHPQQLRFTDHHSFTFRDHHHIDVHE